jgi:hypothetical protein
MSIDLIDVSHSIGASTTGTTSLLITTDRLGQLGENSESKLKVYRELLMSSATMDWGFGQIGTHRD